MNRKMIALALAGFAFGSGTAAHASPPCVIQKVCIGIQIHCPAAENGPPPSCLCVDQWVAGYQIKQCVL